MSIKITGALEMTRLCPYVQTINNYSSPQSVSDGDDGGLHAVMGAQTG